MTDPPCLIGIVDPDQRSAAACAAVLQIELGLRVAAGHDVAELLRRLDHRVPALLVIGDHPDPGTDLTPLQALRTRFPRIPVIALEADGDRIRGADAVLSRPVDAVRLIVVVQKLLRLPADRDGVTLKMTEYR